MLYFQGQSAVTATCRLAYSCQATPFYVQVSHTTISNVKCGPREPRIWSGLGRQTLTQVSRWIFSTDVSSLDSAKLLTPNCCNAEENVFVCAIFHCTPQRQCKELFFFLHILCEIGRLHWFVFTTSSLLWGYSPPTRNLSHNLWFNWNGTPRYIYSIESIPTERMS